MLWTLFRFLTIEDNRNKPKHDYHRMWCRGSHASLRAPRNTLIWWLSKKYYLNLTFPEGKLLQKYPLPVFFPPTFIPLSVQIYFDYRIKWIHPFREICLSDLIIVISKRRLNHHWLSFKKAIVVTYKMCDSQTIMCLTCGIKPCFLYFTNVQHCKMYQYHCDKLISNTSVKPPKQMTETTHLKWFT